MTAQPPTPRDLERLIAHADGEGTPDERAAFEAELEQRPELARALQQLHANDTALRDHFAAPPSTPARCSRRQFRIYGAVAALAAALAITITLSVFFMHEPVRTVQLGHARGVFEGPFEPAEVCDTREKFRQYGLDTFGVPLLADFQQAAASNVALIGWTAYEGRYGRDVEAGEKPLRVLLARAPGGERVIVVFRPPGTLRFDTNYTHGFTQHTTMLGGLVVDEISTLEKPVVLPLLGVEGE
ncbi:MAG: hypothetical protein NCW75_14435 [Phycisphaera sp.]|nr:MAG: hypothetical protein NCW75_14435 [Phycisphaera sp.]